MSEVSINEECLPKLVQLCKNSISEIFVTIKKLDNTNSLVSQEWKDSKYKEFSTLIINCKNSLVKTAAELERCEKYLTNLLRITIEYDNIHLGNNVSNVSNSSIENNTTILCNFNSTYQERLQQTPISNGTWSGQRGESVFISNNDNANAYLIEKNVEGILYSNGIPDFSIVSKGTVKIEDMSDKRALNFRQADEKLAKEKGCSPREVKEWRETNKYTWHECNDMFTCMKIPSIINGTFGHLGGVSECNRVLEEDFDE